MTALTVGFRKHSGPTPANEVATQIITDCGNFTLDFKQASVFSIDLLWLTLFVEGVNDHPLDICQVSTLPRDCVAHSPRLRDHLEAQGTFAGVLS